MILFTFTPISCAAPRSSEVATIALPVLENLIYKVNATMITIVTPKVRSVA